MRDVAGDDVFLEGEFDSVGQVLHQAACPESDDVGTVWASPILEEGSTSAFHPDQQGNEAERDKGPEEYPQNDQEDDQAVTWAASLRVSFNPSSGMWSDCGAVPECTFHRLLQGLALSQGCAEKSGNFTDFERCSVFANRLFEGLQNAVLVDYAAGVFGVRSGGNGNTCLPTEEGVVAADSDSLYFGEPFSPWLIGLDGQVDRC